MGGPPRLLLACSVLGALIASSATALTLPHRAADIDTVALPGFSQGSSPTSAAAPASAAAEAAGPPVTGRQIAELVAGPAAQRAAALADQAKAADAPSAVPAPPRGRDDIDELAARIKQACADGVLKGRICRSH